MEPGLVFQGNRIDGVDRVAGADPATDRDQKGGASARANDDVRYSRRAVQVVPLLQLSLLAFDDQETFAGENEEALLMVLSVVERDRLPRPDDTEIEAKLGEALTLLEVAVHAGGSAVVPLHLANVADEPTPHKSVTL